MQLVARMPTWSPAFTPASLQRVREPVRPLVELAVGDLAARVDERDAVGHLVGRELEQVGEVVSARAHAPNVEHVPSAASGAVSSGEQQVGGGVEVFVDALGTVDAAHPAVQRRQPHLHEDARDAHLALGRRVALGAVDRAR